MTKAIRIRQPKSPVPPPGPREATAGDNGGPALDDDVPPLPGNGLTAWSWSRYETYAQCPFKFAQEVFHNNRQPQNESMRRGAKMHDEIADFLRKKTDVVPPCVKNHTDIVMDLRENHDPIVEQKWGFNKTWGRTTYFGDNVWLRASLDALVLYPDHTGEAIDWKSGRRYKKNDEQIELFGLVALVRYPNLHKITTRLTYVDMDAGPESEVYDEFHAKDKEKLKRKWEDKVRPMFEDTILAPRQNDRCHFCHLNRSNGGPCRYG